MRILPALVLAVSVAASATSLAAGKVLLEIATDPEFSSLDAQNWQRVFAGVKTSVRIRSSRSGDTVKITTTGTKTSPIYSITGRLTERNELLLPGAKFTIRDAARIKEYIKAIEEGGTPDERKTVAFGLNTKQFETLRKDLTQPLTFSTQGKDRAEVLTKVAAELSHDIALQAGVRDALKEAGDVSDELRGMSIGTALACVLRPAGLGLMPQVVGGKVRLDVRSELKESDAWPLGMLASDEQRRKLIPPLFEFVDAEIPAGRTMADALDAISKKLDAPILLDHNGLAELDLDLSKVKVAVAPTRVAPAVLLSRLLGKANPRLKWEMRIDESDKPFIWVTIFRKS